MINVTAIRALFGSAKLWLAIGAAVVIGGLVWSAYSSLKESIRLEIHAAIDQKEIQFKGDVQVVGDRILNLNDADMSKLMTANTQNLTKLMKQLADLEKQVRDGSLTEADRRNLASLARYRSVVIAYCNGDKDPTKCLKDLGAE